MDVLEKKDLKNIPEYEYDFPKYTTQFINQINQNSQATRPKVVGQLSNLIHECPYENYEGWEKWYLENYSSSIDEATNIILKNLDNYKKALNSIDKEMVKLWVKDLVITKTFEGLKLQESIIKYFANKKGVDWRLATTEEESKGIDGFIGDDAVQVKPISHKRKAQLPEDILCDIIYYEKTKKYVKIYHNFEL